MFTKVPSAILSHTEVTHTNSLKQWREFRKTAANLKSSSSGITNACMEKSRFLRKWNVSFKLETYKNKNKFSCSCFFFLRIKKKQKIIVNKYLVSLIGLVIECKVVVDCDS